MRFLSTGGRAPAASLTAALFQGLAPDGGLYVPESIDRWSDADLASLASCSLVEAGIRVLRPFVDDVLGGRALLEAVERALTFPIPLVEVEPGIFALELFHGPTLAFKDIGARVMATLVAALRDDSAPLTILVATSGDTGSAVGHAFHGLDGVRVVILYPHGRISPTQEAQLTMFNASSGSNVCAYAVSGAFDDCQRLVKAAFGDEALRRTARLSSANSINIGRLLPQMIYYFWIAARGVRDAVVCTPSGNFGNLTAGVMAKRAGAPIASFVAATNVNDVVPHYLRTGRFEPRASVATITNAMDCANPSNFARMSWLYGGKVDDMRREIAGSVQTDDDVRRAIRHLYEERGYLLDPHSAVAYLGLAAQAGRDGRPRVFLATAHPAKFAEIVEPIVGRPVEKPAPLAAALAVPPAIRPLEATMAALREALGG
jgi:threonine synthase